METDGLLSRAAVAADGFGVQTGRSRRARAQWPLLGELNRSYRPKAVSQPRLDADAPRRQAVAQKTTTLAHLIQQSHRAQRRLLSDGLWAQAAAGLGKSGTTNAEGPLKEAALCRTLPQRLQVRARQHFVGHLSQIREMWVGYLDHLAALQNDTDGTLS